MFLSASSPAIGFVSPNYPTIGAIAGSYGGVAWDDDAALLLDVTGKTRPWQRYNKHVGSRRTWDPMYELTPDVGGRGARGIVCVW